MSSVPFERIRQRARWQLSIAKWRMHWELHLTRACGTAGSRAARRVPPSSAAYPVRQLHFSPIISSARSPRSPSRDPLPDKAQSDHAKRSTNGSPAPCPSPEVAGTPSSSADRAFLPTSPIQAPEGLHNAHRASPGGSEGAKRQVSSPASTTSSARSAQLASVLRELQLGDPAVHHEEPGARAPGGADPLPVQARDDLLASPLSVNHRFLAPSEPSSSKDRCSPSESDSSVSGYHSPASNAATTTYHSLRTSGASEGAVSSALVKSRDTGASERGPPCVPRRPRSPAAQRRSRDGAAPPARADDGDEASPVLAWTRVRPTTSRRVIVDDDADSNAVRRLAPELASQNAAFSASGSPQTPASDVGSQEKVGSGAAARRQKAEPTSLYAASSASGSPQTPASNLSFQEGLSRGSGGSPPAHSAPSSKCSPSSPGSPDLVLGRSARKPRFCLLEDSDGSDDALSSRCATPVSQPKAGAARRRSSGGSRGRTSPRGAAGTGPAARGRGPIAPADGRRRAAEAREDRGRRDPYEFPGEEGGGGAGESAAGFLGGKAAGRRPLLEANGMCV